MSNVIVVGCGRVGSQLASLLSESGNNVCCIDRSTDAFANLGRNFNGSTVQGVGFDEEVLIRAGVEECDVLAAVTQYDNANLMCAEVANRIFDVPHVIARLYNPDHARAYSQLGIDYVCGTALVADEIFSKVTAGHGSYITTFGNYEILKFSLNLNTQDDEGRDDGRKFIHVDDIERDHEIRVIAFERADGSITSIPSEDSVLYDGDTILVCAQQDHIEQLSRYMQPLKGTMPFFGSGSAD